VNSAGRNFRVLANAHGLAELLHSVHIAEDSRAGHKWQKLEPESLRFQIAVQAMVKGALQNTSEMLQRVQTGLSGIQPDSTCRCQVHWE